MLEDAWGDFFDMELQAKASDEDVSALRLVAPRTNGVNLYKDSRDSAYVICSPELKAKICKERQNGYKK